MDRILFTRRNGMSIFTNKQLIDRASGMDRDELIIVVSKIVSLPVSPSMKSNFARIIMGDQEAEARELVTISPDKVVTKRALMNLADSPIMDYLGEFISSALDPRGPFATRDIMLLAAEKKDQKAFYITKNGISQSYKNHVGLLLQMAGFERISHYDRNTRRPIKAWKSIYGWGHMSAEERSLEVRNIIKRELEWLVAKPLPTLKDFL